MNIARGAKKHKKHKREIIRIQTTPKSRYKTSFTIFLQQLCLEVWSEGERKQEANDTFSLV